MSKRNAVQAFGCDVIDSLGGRVIVSNRWIYDGAKAHAWGDCGIAVFDAEGIVTPQIAGGILGDCAAAMGQWQSDALVARYTKANMQIDAEALLGHALRVAHRTDALALPTALVVKVDDLPMWRSYCALMAQAGIVRGAFTDSDAALRWARLQAAIYSADRRRR